MNKVIIAIVGSLLAISIIVIVSSTRNNEKVNIQPFDSAQGKPISTVPVPTLNIKLNTYSDSSGFVFQYPLSLTVSSVMPLANSYYADVEATASGKTGKAKVVIESTTIKSIADLRRSDAQIPKTVTQTKLADLDAIEFNNDKVNTTMAIDVGTLITITTPITDKSFWEPIHKAIVSSFKFSAPSAAPAATGSSTGGGGDDVVFESEEVVQ